MPLLEHAFLLVVFGIGAVIATATLVAFMLRSLHLNWSWAALGLPAAFLLWPVAPPISLLFWISSLLACRIGLRWRASDLAAGGDCAQSAAESVRIVDVIQSVIHRCRVRRDGWLQAGWLVVGHDRKRHPVCIPVGYESGAHTLIVGATGSGKTVTQAWLAGRMIEAGHGAIVVDPKGDRLLRTHLASTAAETNRAFLEWTPQGPCSYNPYAHGSESEIADKALAGERFTEPHYLRQAQRYLGHAVRAIRGTGETVTAASLMAHMTPGVLDATARKLPAEQAQVIHAYLDALSDRQKHDLSGIRDRLSILAESELGRWLEPDGAVTAVDLPAAVKRRAVLYIRLESDRRPLLASMLAAAIITDLNTVAADLRDRPIPTLVMIDEFSSIAAGFVARLFGRARDAGVSLILATQELADLKTPENRQLRDQVLGNLQTLIAHRQSVPESAERIASFAGTRPVWITTQQTEHRVFGLALAGNGTRRRGREYETHPALLASLPVGRAVVITPGSGQPPKIAAINHPGQVGR